VRGGDGRAGMAACAAVNVGMISSQRGSRKGMWCNQMPPPAPTGKPLTPKWGHIVYQSSPLRLKCCVPDSALWARCEPRRLLPDPANFSWSSGSCAPPNLPDCLFSPFREKIFLVKKFLFFFFQKSRKKRRPIYTETGNTGL
jgi:hypothetical protein